MNFIFPYIRECPGNVIIPTDEVIFFRGVGSTTNQQIYIYIYIYIHMCYNAFGFILKSSSRIHAVGNAASKKSGSIEWLISGALFRSPSIETMNDFIISRLIFILFKGCRPCRRPRKRETGNGVSWLRSSVL